MGELRLIIEQDPDEAEAAEVYVDGHIDGRAYRFLLDTGAARTGVITDDYTAAFEPVGTDHSSGVFAPASSDLITVSSISLGPIARRRFTIARAPAGHGVKNLIGMDLLSAHRCLFCFDEQRVVVDPDAVPDDSLAFEPLFLDPRLHPYVDVRFGDRVARAVWDTGASITVVDSSFIDAHPAFFAQAGQSTGTDATGAQMESGLFVMSAAVIGGHLSAPHRVAAVDLSRLNATLDVPMHLILGYSTLRQARWLFDFPGRKWAVSRWLA